MNLVGQGRKFAGRWGELKLGGARHTGYEIGEIGENEEGGPVGKGLNLRRSAGAPAQHRGAVVSVLGP